MSASAGSSELPYLVIFRDFVVGTRCSAPAARLET